MLTCSITTCTLNGAKRLPGVFKALAAQGLTADDEVIVVDNGSTDETIEVAEGLLRQHGLSGRVLVEPTAGVANARRRAMDAARGDLIVIVDDDNELDPGFIDLARSLMDARPELGAAGGPARLPSDALVDETAAPFLSTLAIGRQEFRSGVPRMLWGAGLVVRRRAWTELRQAGFDFILTGRQGAKQLAPGEDGELVHALVLAGWDLAVDDGLSLVHRVAPSRTRWDEVLRHVEGFGAASVGLDAYDAARRPGGSIVRKTVETWWFARWLRSAVQTAILFGRRGELSQSVYERRFQAGRRRALVRARGTYRSSHLAVRGAKWRQHAVGPGPPVE